MRIVTAETQYLKLIALLFDKYRVFYKKSSNYSAAETFIAQRLIKKDSVIMLALNEIKNKPMGFVQLYPSFTSVGMRRIFILNDLYVDDIYRRQGVAKALIQQAQEYAINENAAKIELKTHITNKEAQALYKKLGFQKDNEFIIYNLPIS